MSNDQHSTFLWILPPKKSRTWVGPFLHFMHLIVHPRGENKKIKTIRLRISWNSEQGPVWYIWTCIYILMKPLRNVVVVLRREELWKWSEQWTIWIWGIESKMKTSWYPASTLVRQHHDFLYVNGATWDRSFGENCGVVQRNRNYWLVDHGIDQSTGY